MNLSDVKAITIPEGDVTQISVGGVVIWKAVTDALQMFNPYGVPPENKFVNRITGGLTIPSATGGTWRYSEFIAVEANTEYLFGMAVYATATTAGIAWYDSTQTFVSGVNATALKNANGVATSPSTAAYVRFSWRIDEGYNTDWEHQVWLCKNGVCDHWTPWIG